LILVCGAACRAAPAAEAVRQPDAQRGRAAVNHGGLNPPLWSAAAYANAWKQWGLRAKPKDYARAFQTRYGLVADPEGKHGLPLGMAQSQGLLGKGIVNTCLLCHAGAIAGRTYIGLGNASLELQGLFDELYAADEMHFRFPFRFSNVRGTIDPVSPLAFMMGFRDPDLNLRQRLVKLDMAQDVCSKPPAWWLLKRKKTRDWTGVIAANSTRVDLVNLLSPLNSGAHVKGHHPDFVDIHAFLLGIRSPAYPFPVDRRLAARGRTVFARQCARCHGSYGPHPTYPNRIVPLKAIGTDPVLALAITEKNEAYLNQTWLAGELGPDGKPYRITNHAGYQAPPLDGIWATAPYFHNGSVPTAGRRRGPAPAAWPPGAGFPG
jgi:mono/diheme cytochrome c family protein